MADVNVVDKVGRKVKSISVPDAIFSSEVNNALLYSVIRWQRAKSRRGTACTKTRSEVKHSTRKPFKQKGTGRARQGSTSSPLLEGGGVVFGPKPRDYGYRMNRKAKAIALRSAIAYKFKKERVKIVDSLDLLEIKTREVKKILDAMKIKSALLVDGPNENLSKSASNLRSVKYLDASGLNVFDILNYEYLVITEKSLSGLTGRITRSSGK